MSFLNPLFLFGLAATVVPACLRVTAWCEEPTGARTVMGVAHRSLPLSGVQFHPESVLSRHGREIVASFLREEGGAR